MLEETRQRFILWNEARKNYLQSAQGSSYSIQLRDPFLQAKDHVTMLKVWITCRYMYQSALNMDQHEPNTKEVLVKAFEKPQSHP